MYQLIIRGRWKSPKHSNDRRKDDTHEIKRKILKEINEFIYSKDVGKNPDIDIDPKTKKIILKGRGPFKGKVYKSSINSEEYFNFQYIITKDLNKYKYFDIEDDLDFYVIPPKLDIIERVLDYLFESQEEINVLIIVSS